MKKKIIALLLVTLTLVSAILTSCSKVVEIPQVESKIYTLYTIAEKGTTPEAIRQTELALNRIVFYRLGFCVKLVMLTEDEYDKAIEDKFKEIEEYEKNKSNKKDTDKKDKDKSSDENSEVSDVITGEEILEMLENGKDINPDRPRLDIFLVRGQNNYLNLVREGKLAKLTEKLSSEGQLLKYNLYPSVFDAAKVDKGIYGIPMNSGIGQYEYMVFDKELLDKYHIDVATMKSMRDLESYLKIIKENEADVIPLQKASSSPDFSFLFSDGFPAFVRDKFVISALEDKALTEYYSLISKYNSLGYLPEKLNTEKRFAVTFVKGTEQDIKELSEKTGKEYIKSIYSKPVAKSEELLENIFCVSKYCKANDLANVIKFITLLETDPLVQNTLTYGVEGVHYDLVKDPITDIPQVKRRNNDYVVKREYTGNAFQCYTTVDEDPLLWEKLKKQNLDSVNAVDLGFGFANDQLKIEVKDENGKFKDVILEGPDYISIIQEVMKKHYDNYLNGTAGRLDYNKFKDENEEKIKEKIKEHLEKSYTERLTAQYTEKVRESYAQGTQKYNDIFKQSEVEALDSLAMSLRKTIRGELTQKFKEEMPEATAEEIKEKVNKYIHDDEYMHNQVKQRIDKKEIDSHIKTTFNKKLDATLNIEISNIPVSEEFTKDLAALLESDTFKKECEEMVKVEFDSELDIAFEGGIFQKITKLNKEIIAECNEAIEKAVLKFAKDHAKELDMTQDEILVELGFKDPPKDEDDKEEDNKDDEEPEEKPKENVYFYVFLRDKLTKQFYAVKGDPNKPM